MSKIKSFIKEVVARVGGDTAEVIAQKNFRKATSAIELQIAALNAKIIEQEDAVNAAEEALSAWKFPSTLITDNKSYVSGIQSRFDTLENAKAALAATRESYEYFRQLLVDYNEEV